MDDQKYVTRLMRARCSKGTMENYLNVDLDHGIVVGADMQPLMNANDHVSGRHVIHFGCCESDQNPERMSRKGLVGGLLSGGIADALEDVGIMTCKCKPNTPNPWEFVNEDNIVEGAPALMVCSKLTCRYGGIIEIIDPDNEDAICGLTDIDEEFEQLWQQLEETLRYEPWNFTKIKDIILKISSTDTGNTIERQMFDAIKGLVSPILAFEYVGDKDPSKDFYRTNETYGIQRLAGFMDLWDELGFLLGMDLDTEIVVFTPKDSNKEYRLQFWKGSYGYGGAFGGEIGFYCRNTFWAKLSPYSGSGKIDDRFDNYACVSGEDELRTIQKIYDATTGELLIKNDTADYAAEQNHFWNLAIKMDYGYSKEDLVVLEKIDVPDPNMYTAMLEALKKTKTYRCYMTRLRRILLSSSMELLRKEYFWMRKRIGKIGGVIILPFFLVIFLGGCSVVNKVHEMEYSGGPFENNVDSAREYMLKQLEEKYGIPFTVVGREKFKNYGPLAGASYSCEVAPLDSPEKVAKAMVSQTTYQEVHDNYAIYYFKEDIEKPIYDLCKSKQYVLDQRISLEAPGTSKTWSLEDGIETYLSESGAYVKIVLRFEDEMKVETYAEQMLDFLNSIGDIECNILLQAKANKTYIFHQEINILDGYDSSIYTLGSLIEEMEEDISMGSPQ